MSTAKSLTDEQVATIRSWAEDGANLSDIQKRLGEELEVRVTYLETRFLLEDLKIELLPDPVEEPEEPEAEESAEGDGAESDAGEEEAADPGDGSVTVTVDKVQRPGAIISGRVDFGGGNTAAWWLDQMGRLGMDSDNPEFRPSEEQAMAFQQELQKAIQESGM
jgi:hypothetical protein